MCHENLNALKKLLPQNILDKGVYLGSIGVDDFVWKWLDALIVIDYLSLNGIFISGGDVYADRANRIRPIGDGWYAIKSGYLPTLDEIENAKTKGLEYINKYVDRNGEDFLFAIVPLA
jgi:hypothetical protein